MTRGGVKEYIEAVQGHYLKASRKEKGRILDEVTKVTGYHRKAAIRLLGQRGKRKPVGRRGRTKQYGVEVVAALKEAWEASDRMCSRRLRPFLPELVEALERHGELNVTGELREQLCRISADTIDRLLKSHRQRGLRRPFSTTKPGSLLKAAIPIRTFADWDEETGGTSLTRILFASLSVSGSVSIVMMPTAHDWQNTPLSFLSLASPPSMSCSVRRVPHFSQK